MACVIVWEIAAAKDKSAEQQFREFLIKLSRRQMKHNVSYTNPALLAGLWIYLSMLEVLQTYSSNELELMHSMAKEFLSCVDTYVVKGYENLHRYSKK